MTKDKDVLQEAIDFIDDMATHALGPELKALYKVKLHLKSLLVKCTSGKETIIQYEVYKEESGMLHGWYRSTPIEYETYPEDKRRIIESPEPGFQNATTYTPDELQKLFIRNCCEGYFDECALINQGNMKEWFEWMASLKIIKEQGHGIL